MNAVEISGLSFCYAGETKAVLKDVSFCLGKNEFCLVCGATGSGKSTLLSLLKPEISPRGTLGGQITISKEIGFVGFVGQDPEEQIVTDKVWHELAFGLENLGLPRAEIRRRVAETAAYFGIEEWFDKDTADLSGGQKQILSLASVCVMRPGLLILDEPTAQLDPISADRFLSILGRLHREQGMTVLLSEHRLEEVFPYADKVLGLDGGRVAVFGDARQSLGALASIPPLGQGLPAAVRLWAQTGGTGQAPLSIREGREYLERGFRGGSSALPAQRAQSGDETALEMRDVFFSYGEKEVLSGLSLKVPTGSIYCLLGGNGAGKSTLASLAAGLLRPVAGSVRIFGRKIQSYKNQTLYRDCVALLSQNPRDLFLENTVGKELAGADTASFPFDLTPLWDRHPYDLSGGQQQLVALCKVLSCHPRLLILDEPTKGLDAEAKKRLSQILRSLREGGMTLLVVTHDVEFAAAVADRCGMLFAGELTDEGEPHAFFAGNQFYSPAATRMTRGIFKGVISVEEAAVLCRECGRKEE